MGSSPLMDIYQNKERNDDYLTISKAEWYYKPASSILTSPQLRDFQLVPFDDEQQPIGLALKTDDFVTLSRFDLKWALHQ